MATDVTLPRVDMAMSRLRGWVTAAVVVAIAAAVVRPRRVVVDGPSMEPTLQRGDRLLVVRRRRPRPGDLVAVRDPRDPRRLLVKRVTERTDDHVVVVGDNRGRSTDSRRFGPLHRRTVVGRVVYRYAPPGRTGFLLSRAGGAIAGAEGDRGTLRVVTSLDHELERLLASDYLAGADERPLEDVRAMRAECEEAETAVSYLRRVAQGRLDVVHSFLGQRQSGQEGGDLDAVVEDLSSIIGSGPARPAGYGRLPSQMSPDLERDDLTEEIDAVLDAGGIGRLPAMSEEELRSLATRLSAVEKHISDERHALHQRIDALKAVIVSRYKSGEVSPDGLLT
jgi:nickel-type superoxide dismutase maturation protease